MLLPTFTFRHTRALRLSQADKQQQQQQSAIFRFYRVYPRRFSRAINVSLSQDNTRARKQYTHRKPRSLFHDLVPDDRDANGHAIVVDADPGQLVGAAQVRRSAIAFVHPVAAALAAAAGLTPERCGRLVGTLHGQRLETHLGFGPQVQVVGAAGEVWLVVGGDGRGPPGLPVEITFGLGEP